MFNKGDIVAYRTKDFHGYQYIFAEVRADSNGKEVGLTTIPAGVSLIIPANVLTKVKTVWQDTMKVVADTRESYILFSLHGWFATTSIMALDEPSYLGKDGRLYETMGPNRGTYFETKGKLIDHFLDIGIDIIEKRQIVEDALKNIAKELDGIDVSDCTQCEKNIAEILIDAGFMQINDRGDEVAGWKEYTKL